MRPAGEWKKKAGRAAQMAANALARAVFPPRCLSCGRFFHPDPDPARETGPAENGRFDAARFFAQSAAECLCPECARGFSPARSPLCPACGAVFPTPAGDDHVCGECLARPKRFDMARACGIYSGPLKKAVHSFKYRGRTELARPFSRTLFLFFQSAWAGRPVDMIVPAPLHPKRLRERGFNQSFLLVKDWPLFMARGGFGNPAPDVSPFVIERRRKTSPQTGLSRKERRRNVKNAFFVTDASRARGRRVLLVDDVYTTGATLDECARALLKEGAAGVDALTLARAMPSV